ncbi:MAG: dTDP-glucose 4,6-dehydratase [Candidatus Aminicenantes bacterium]|nr:MAG: dTDP-glucose 4,6-dehydratase [Candidatus Aminicenantes bacterium]RLE03268.1 MAG: dTDP-glucose 4,6-dehydratase [Candidatus Aminicenantes bacterium]
MVEERSLTGKTILVTGGAGFIGSNLIHYLLENYSEIKIINLDKLTYAGNLDNLRDVETDPRYEFIQGDIRDRALVAKVIPKVQGIIHLAAETHVDRSILDAGEFILTDVFGTFVLLDVARQIGQLEFFLHVSTDEVYGSRETGYFSEDDALNPSSPYAASKAGADRLAHAYWVTYRLPVIIVRPSNNYGPYQYPEKFIPLFITNALEGKTLPLYGTGENVRDWLFVEDHCRALELVIKKGKIGEVYNIGANNEIPNIKVARQITQHLGKSEDLIKLVKDRPGHDQRYALDCQKIRRLGWAPQVSFEEGLQRTVEWYCQHEEWWRKIKEKSSDYRRFYKQYYQDR